jgi:Ala-tRNA(Pro) deacylase
MTAEPMGADRGQTTATTAAARARLARRLAELGVAAPTIPYPAHETVEEGKRLRGDAAGTFTKNLLLANRQGRLFLLTVEEERQLDLKLLHRQIGAQSRLRFALPDTMIARLGVSPGALTPLAIIDDAGGHVTVVLDAALLTAEQVNVHPLVNTESVGLRPDDLLAFIRSCGREPVIIDFTRLSAGDDRPA